MGHRCDSPGKEDLMNSEKSLCDPRPSGDRLILLTRANRRLRDLLRRVVIQAEMDIPIGLELLGEIEAEVGPVFKGSESLTKV